MPEGVAEEQGQHQQAGQKTGDKEPVDADPPPDLGLLGDDAVEDEGERGGEEQAEAARGGDQAEIEMFVVAGLLQGRIEERAEGDDGHP